MSAARFEADWRTQYIVQRGLLTVSQASRSVPAEMKDRHPEIRWSGVRDIGNVLRHGYASLSFPLLWNVVQDELPPLRRAIEMMSAQLRG